MRNLSKLALGVTLSLFGMAGMALSQSNEVPFGVSGHDVSKPIQIVSDRFVVSQKNGSAEFVGGVVVSQGELKISADKITAVYAMKDGKQTGKIGKVIATGNIILSRPPEAAEADTAIFTIADSTVVLEGNVMLTQEQNMLVGEKIFIDLKAGTATVEGRVKTVFNAGEITE